MTWMVSSYDLKKKMKAKIRGDNTSRQKRFFKDKCVYVYMKLDGFSAATSIEFNFSRSTFFFFFKFDKYE